MGKAQKNKELRREERENAFAKKARDRKTAGIVTGVVLLLGAGVLGAAALANRDDKPAVTASVSPTFNPSPPTNSSETPMTNPATTKTATIETEKGTIKLELYADKAPKTVEQITSLISEGFYNGLKFHRVVPGFVVQGGDPKGDGSGGSKKPNIPFETNDLKHDKGVLAMARSQDKNSANSQFYITLAPQASLDGNYVVFGKVTAGMDVVEKITQGDTMKTITLGQ